MIGAMAGPDRRIVGQLPISIYSGWDKVQDVLSVLAQHDYGQFRSSATLVDAMWRDDRFKGVMSARIGSLLAAPIEHRAANQSRKARKAAELLQGNDDEPGVFDLIFPASVLKQLSGWMVTMGLCVAELVWIEHPVIKAPGTKYPMWIPRLRPWHPQFVYWDWSTFSYVITTRDGTIQLPRVDENVYSDGKWFVYAPDGYQYGWLRAAVRSIAMLYVARGWGNRDWSRHSEVQGIAIRKAFVPESADDQDKENFYQDVVNAGSELTVMVPVGEGGRDKGFDVVYEEAKARTWECFKDLLANKNVDIAIDLLGQDLSTQAAPTGLGSGVANIQNQVRLDIRQGDAKLALALRNQVLSWWARFNFGDPELAPRSAFQVDPPEDELAEGNTFVALGNGLSALKAASDAVDVDAILESKGIPMRSEEEIEAEKQANMERAVAAFGKQREQGAIEDGKPGQKQPLQLQGKREQAAEDEKGAAQLSALKPHPTPGPVKRYEFQGLLIAVENVAGTVRCWYEKGSATPRGSTKMAHDYGYIEGHAGSDGEDLDVYIGPDVTASLVHVVHQLAAPDYVKHDEDKVFLGFPSADAARAAFVAHRDDGDRAIGGMTQLPLERFRAKLTRRTGRGKITARAELRGGELAPAPAVRAAQLGATMAALEGLVERAGMKTTALRSIAGKRRAARYADRLQDNARKHAARALAVDLSAIKGEIEKASSFADLRKRIAAAYKGMDPERLAQVIRKANLMAHLYGRLEAVDSL